MPSPTPKPAPPKTAPPTRERPAPVLFKDWASI